MPLTELNHYFVRANDLERSHRFYCDVLGFEEMPRPDFPFPGYWLGVNGKIQVHMGPHDIPDSSRYYLGTTAASATNNAGVVDHVAFLATDPEGFARRFAQHAVPVRKRFFREYRGKRVIFGHTRTEFLPQELSAYTPDDPTDLWAGEAVVGIDTGCGNGGFLTAVELPEMRVYESR